MTGRHWILRHPDAPECVCIIPEPDLRTLWSIGLPLDVVATSAELVPIAEFLKRAKRKDGA